jgi:haloalkane dehalogenase
VEFAARLLEDLDLRDVTAVVHDWGGPIGLRLAVERPGRISRMVIMDTGMFTGEQAMSDAWHRFRDFVERTEDPPISLLVRNACARGMSDAVAAAYDAPFPTQESKAGARAFPLMLPTSPDMPGAAAGKRAQDALIADDRPKLVLWADADPVLPFGMGEAVAKLFRCAPPTRIDNASHFLQEDAGEEIGGLIAEWLVPTAGRRSSR